MQFPADAQTAAQPSGAQTTAQPGTAPSGASSTANAGGAAPSTIASPAPPVTKPGGKSRKATVTATALTTKNTAPVCPTAAKGQVTCFAIRRTDVKAVTGIVRKTDTSAVSAPTGYGPSDLLSAYNLPAGGGAGTTVAIVDAYDDPNAEQDLALYRQQYGLPACGSGTGCFQKVDETGGTKYPQPDPHWAEEISLDLDMVSAVAPQAHIILVEANTPATDDMGAAEDQAVAMGAKYVSNSWGSQYTTAPGSGEDPSEHTSSDGYFNHPGVVITASSGDNGYGVAYPASSPYVTSVGGTSLTKDSSARGWSESAWGGAGSGCSAYEPKPSFQSDTGCSHRSVSDVSAVADPLDGVAVYDSYQAAGGSSAGWFDAGGTSASTPIIASVYADAGTPRAGTYPNTYPYLAKPGGLNDVTTGSNDVLVYGTSTCTQKYLCNGAPGYDGPTGLGTPNGLTAFQVGTQGSVQGTVTAGGQPLGGAAVSIDGFTTTTAADGSYQVSLQAGTYSLSVNAFGYNAWTQQVTIQDGSTVKDDAALTALQTVTVSGTVTAATPGWPVYAAISVDGDPSGPVYSDPKTGAYTLKLPANAAYTLRTTAAYQGYEPATTSISLGSSSMTQDISVKTDLTTCDAPGYGLNTHGIYQTFDSTSAPAGWSVANNTTARGWVFNDPGHRTNLTGGTGSFAIVDSAYAPPETVVDSDMVSPTVDLSTATVPDISFDTMYSGGPLNTKDPATIASVDLSLDNGATWTSVWTPPTVNLNSDTHIDIPVPQAAGNADAKVRFRYAGTWAGYWEVDDLLIGDITCDAVPGGLIVGQVSDANTGAALPGVTVSEAGQPDATSVASGDPAMKGAFYYLFSPTTGSVSLTAAKSKYTTTTKTVTTSQGGVVEQDIAMGAGRLTLTPGSVSKTLGWGAEGTQTVTVKNTGTAPASLKMGESPESGTQAGVSSAPAQRVKTSVYLGDAAIAAKKHPDAKTTAPATPEVAGTAWQQTADLPVPVVDNLAASYDGKLYAGFGFEATDGADSHSLYRYDPVQQSWTQLASAQDGREAATGGFVNGKLYVTGGWGLNGVAIPRTEVYDPAGNTWSTTTDSPAPHAGSASAVVGSALYVIGGCTDNTCASGSSDVYALDTTTGTWTKEASYPEAIEFTSCAGIEGEVYCAGGSPDGNNGVADTFAYDPQSNTWTKMASLPAPQFASAYAAANGRLLIQDGIIYGGATNTGVAYDPETDSWSSLPNTTTASYLGAGATGFYVVGGTLGGGVPSSSVQVLPGMDVDSGNGVAWMSESATTETLAPGASATFTLTLNAADPSVAQPGTYQASLFAQSDTPYRISPVPVAMTVTPPKTWGQVAGVVQYTDSSGAEVPIAGATVQIDGGTSTFTLHTDAQGRYSYWLDRDNSPLTLIATKAGYQPAAKTAKLSAGKTVTVSFTLLPES